jgi:2-succinyl-6-hydroxy-2,4-cyclohexadiene-1-carboxylate synthase
VRLSSSNGSPHWLWRHARDSTPLVLLHGFCGHPTAFTATVERLAPERTIAGVFLPGHAGGPDVPGSFDRTVDLIASNLQAAGLGPAHVAGYSLGGRIAVGLVARHPALVSRATLISTHFGLATEAERSARRRQDQIWARLLREQGLTAFVEAWERQPLFATQNRLPRETLSFQRQLRMMHSAGSLAAALEVLGLAEMPDFAQTLTQADVPVELVVGEHDQRFCEPAASMVRRLARGRIHVIPECGHNPLLEAPEALAAILDEGR